MARTIRLPNGAVVRQGDDGSLEQLEGPPVDLEQFNSPQPSSQGDGGGSNAPTPPPSEGGGGIGMVAREAGRAVAGGVRDAAQATLETLDWAGDSITKAVGAPVITGNGLEWLSADEIRQRGLEDPNSFWGTLDDMGYELPEVAPNETLVGGIGRGITQFLTGFVGGQRVLRGVAGLSGSQRLGRFATGTGIGTTAARGATVGAATDFTVFDPYEARFADFLRDHVELESPVLDYLAADEDDTQAEGRLKNVLEGLALGVAGEALFATFRAFRRAKRVEQEQGPEAAEETLNRDLDEVREQYGEQFEMFGRETDLGAARGEEAFGRADTDPAVQSPRAGEVTAFNAAGLREPGRETAPVNTDAVREVLRNSAFLRRAGQNGDVDFTEWTTSRFANYDYMDGGPELKRVMNDIANAIDPRAFDNTTTFDRIVAGAVETLEDTFRVNPRVLDSALARMAADAGQQQRIVVAAKIMSQDLAREIETLATRLDAGYMSGRASVADEAKLIRYMERLGELEQNLKAVTQGAAQTTAAGRIRTTDMLTGRELGAQDIIRQLEDGMSGGRKQVQRLVRRIKGARSSTTGRINPRQLQDIARGGRFGRFMDLHNEYWINSILSGPKTQLINLMSNAANTLLLPAERMLGGVLTGNWQAIREGASLYAGIREGLFSSFRFAGKALWREQNILDPQHAIMDTAGRTRHAWTAQNFGMANGPMAGIVDLLGKLVRMPSRGLLTGDEFFKQLNYRMATHARAVSEAQRLLAEGKLTRDQIGAFVKRTTERTIDPQTGRALSDEALEYAQLATFTKSLENGTLSRNIQNLVNRHPILRPVLPFIRTPTNLLRGVVQRTPLLRRLEQQHMADLRSDDPIRVAQAKGRHVTGNMFWAAGVMMALDGRITGGGPADRRLRERLYETGWQPYSVRLGSEEEGYRYVSYARLDPFASFLGMAGDFADMAGQMAEAVLTDLAGLMSISFSRNITNKTYLRGLSDVMEVLTHPDRYAEQWFIRQASTYVPYSSAMRSLRAAIDPVMKETRTIMDGIRSTIPGLSEAVPARRSWITGEPIMYPTGWGSDFMSPLGEAFASMNPITQSDSTDDRVLNELARLEHGFTAPQRKIGNVELSGEQYSRLLELHGTARIGRYTMHQRLDRLMDSYAYDFNRERIADSPQEYRSPRIQMVREVIRDYREQAERQLLREFPELAQAVRQDAQNQLLVNRGRAGEIQRIINY